MGKPGGHYAKWNKSGKEKTNTLWSHLYVESKQTNKNGLQETEKIGGCQGQWDGGKEMDESGQEVQTPSCNRSPGDVCSASWLQQQY